MVQRTVSSFLTTLILVYSILFLPGNIKFQISSKRFTSPLLYWWSLTRPEYLVHDHSDNIPSITVLSELSVEKNVTHPDR